MLETHSIQNRQQSRRELNLPPLEAVGKPNLTTEETAYYTNRTPKTLRSWACYENGPIRPLRINGRLAWPVSEVKRILGIASN